MNDRHVTEELNRRSVYLRVRKKLWIIPAAAIVTAAVFGAVYLLLTQVLRDTRQYQAEASLFIDFAYDEEGKKAHDYFNGATWTDLLTADPALSDAIAAELDEGLLEKIRARYADAEVDIHDIKDIAENVERFTEVPVQAVIQDSMKILVLSDIRVMTLQVTNSDPELVSALRDAGAHALTAYGESRKEFEQISLLSMDPVRRVVLDSRLKNALLLGAFLGLLFSALLLWLSQILDDAVYVPEEAEKRYGLPVAEVRARDGKPLPEPLQEDYEKSRKALSDGKEIEEIRVEQNPESGREYFLVLPCGVKKGAYFEHRISEMKKQGVVLKGLVLEKADAAFLKQYYRL
ncbi:MAG: hypothetical protein J6M46_04540 [Lachnospiraceae bacterium]|nr:hypothetical protein [Lachnospiraceae bacterium]